jgi:hypothetical membrane protein
MARRIDTGRVLLFAGLQLILLINLAAFLYPGYNNSGNLISDLGVGPWPSSGIFTATVMLMGSGLLISAWKLHHEDASRLWVFLMIAGIGDLGVGLFNENNVLPHSFFAIIGLAFLNISAIYSYKLTARPYSLIFIILGTTGLLGWALTPIGVGLGLGLGTMERLVFYPGIIWSIGFGLYLTQKTRVD